MSAQVDKKYKNNKAGESILNPWREWKTSLFLWREATKWRDAQIWRVHIFSLPNVFYHATLRASR